MLRQAKNPKDIIGSNKIPMHLWPKVASVYGAIALYDGALKYGRSNFRAAKVRASIYYDALDRHISAWFEGEDIDAKSGLPTLAHALACIAIIIDAESCGCLIDDRQYNGVGYRKILDEMTLHVSRLQSEHNEKPKHYTKRDNKIK